jgi:pimeloyl-ACP methyl ester carboxylesterase
MNISDWQAKHQTIKLFNQRVSFIDSVVGDKVVLVIHGFGMSSFDYHKVIDELKLSYRLMIPDLIGFGFSSKPTNFYVSFIEQAQMLLRLLEEHNIKEVAIVAQGFGASILCEILSIINAGFSDLKISKIWLLNLSLSVELSPNMEAQGQILKYINVGFMKMVSSFEMFKKCIRLNFCDANTISEEALKTSWELLLLNDGMKTLNFINYWGVEILQSSNRWLDAIKNTSAPIEIIWGMDKSSGDIETPERINHFLTVEKTHLIADCGYIPMLEKPSIFIDILKGV